MKSPLFFRWLRRMAVGVVIFLLTVGTGRLIEVAWQSRYSGQRGPYLQVMTPDGVTLRWQSGRDEAGVVRYGTAPGRLDHTVRESAARVGHVVRLTGLQPSTRYYYAVGNERGIDRGGKDDWFVTAPPLGSDGAVRIWVQGDPGHWWAGSRAVRDAMLKWVAAHPRPGRPLLDLWLTTGDNAYRSGSNPQFQAALFDAYPALLRNIPYMPVYGNHDARRWAFFNIFTFPTAGETGTVASGSEHYFAYNYADIHFVFLDSMDSDRSRDGAMMRWLKRDLAANGQRWLVVLFHHPPYTHGSHNSDNPHDSRGRMKEMRENFLPVLEQAGADLVLSGHSHVYERSYLLACHYGSSATLRPGMIIDHGDGNAQPYRKPLRLTPHAGTVYAVVGSSNNLDNGPLDYPAMAVSRHQRGSLLLDITGDLLEASFVNDDGVVSDHFSIVKSARTPAPRPLCGAE